MNERLNNLENSLIPGEGEVIRLIDEIIGEKPFTEILKREDENGLLYRLVVEVIGDDGDTVRYDYIRAGQHPEGDPSETAIDVIYLNSEGVAVGGGCVAKYVDGVSVKE